MSDESAALRKEIDSFKAATARLSEKINSSSDIWRDSNFISLQNQIGELAKNSRTIIDSSDKTRSNIDRFFTIAGEAV